MDLSTIDDTIFNIKTALEIANTLKDQKVTAAQSERINQLTIAQLEALNSAMHAKFELQEHQESLKELKDEQSRNKTWDKQKKRYDLTTIPGSMAMVYALKALYDREMPPHWICTNCYRLAVRSILQPAWRTNGDWVLQCPACKTEINTGQKEQKIPTYV